MHHIFCRLARLYYSHVALAPGLRSIQIMYFLSFHQYVALYFRVFNVMVLIRLDNGAKFLAYAHSPSPEEHNRRRKRPTPLAGFMFNERFICVTIVILNCRIDRKIELYKTEQTVFHTCRIALRRIHKSRKKPRYSSI
jgi:hypothetical protein